MDQDSAHIVVASKVPMLKLGEYELWRMRMEQYIQMIDYSLWEVIENGNAPPITKIIEGVETIIAPATAEEKAQRRLELKARSTLLMGIPNEHQLKFNSIKDAKSLLQAIEKRFRGNAATKKTQNEFLKAQNKPEIDTLSMDDLYNNLKIYEPIQRTSSTSSKKQNVALFCPSTAPAVQMEQLILLMVLDNASTQATAVLTSTSLTTCLMLSSVLSLQIAMLIMREKRFLKNTGRKFSVNGTKTIGFDKSKVRYDWSDQAEEGPTNFVLMAYSSTSSNSEVSTYSNCSSSCLENVKILKEQNEQLLKYLRTSKLNDIAYKTGLESVEARLIVYKKSESIYEEDIKVLKRNFMPPKPDLSFSGLEEFMNESIVSKFIVKKPIVENSEAKASKAKPKAVRKNNGAPIIEDWVSDSKEEDVPEDKIEKKTIKPSFAKIEFVKSKEQVKSPRKITIKQGNPQQDLQEKGVIDSGCSGHITGNIVNNRFTLRTTDLEAWSSDERKRNEPHKRIFNKGKRVKDLKSVSLKAKRPHEEYTPSTVDLPFSQSLKSSLDAGFKPSGDDEKNVTEEPGKEGGDPINVVGRKASIKLPDEPNMPALEDIIYSDDDDDVGAEADMNNLDAFMPVIPIPTTRVHIDHLVEQIIGDLNLAPQTRRMTKNLEEHVEPKKVIQALQDPSWIEAIQDELLQFKLQKVWTLVDLPNDKRPICTKWVFRNKKDERGIMIKNKARLVAQWKMMRGVSRWGSMGELTFFLGLQVKQKEDEIFISQDKYMADILKKFSFTDVKTSSTPMETQKLLLKDEDGEEVDVYLYRLIIGSLMYLTSLRPDIMFAVCACARYHVDPNP
ncbi:ribonuclease H-like domain-containing protein [Tanacetum coccineum]